MPYADISGAVTSFTTTGGPGHDLRDGDDQHHPQRAVHPHPGLLRRRQRDQRRRGPGPRVRAHSHRHELRGAERPLPRRHQGRPYRVLRAEPDQGAGGGPTCPATRGWPPSSPPRRTSPPCLQRLLERHRGPVLPGDPDLPEHGGDRGHRRPRVRPRARRQRDQRLALQPVRGDRRHPRHLSARHLLRGPRRLHERDGLRRLRRPLPPGRGLQRRAGRGLRSAPVRQPARDHLDRGRPAPGRLLPERAARAVRPRRPTARRRSSTRSPGTSTSGTCGRRRTTSTRARPWRWPPASSTWARRR